MEGISVYFGALQRQSRQHLLPTFKKTLQVQLFPTKSYACFFVLKWRIFPEKSAGPSVVCPHAG
jgi:hypothetical protein